MILINFKLGMNLSFIDKNIWYVHTRTMDAYMLNYKGWIVYDMDDWGADFGPNRK